MSRLREDAANTEELPANLSNWRHAPQSRWAFRNIDKLLSVTPIAAGPARLIEPASSSRRDSLLRRLFLKATSSDAFVVLEDGRVTFERYANGNCATTPHILMSATKAVCGLVAETLEHAGALDLGALASAYVPEIADTVYGDATLRSLLDMRVEAPLGPSEVRAYAIAAGWDPATDAGESKTLQDFIEGLGSRSDAQTGRFRYLSANTDVVGWALERATGKPFGEIVSDVLWKRVGAEHDAYVTMTLGGLPRAAGGICSTARDFARIGQLFVDDGRCGDVQVIPRDVIAGIRSGGNRQSWRDGEWGRAFGFISRDMSYRSGWYVVHEAPGLLFAMGIHGQNLFIDVPNRIVIAKFSSWARPIDYLRFPMTHAYVDRMLRGARRRE